MTENNKVWYEGEKTSDILFVEEDLNVVLKALTILSKHDNDEYNRVKTRIYFQLGLKKMIE